MEVTKIYEEGEKDRELPVKRKNKTFFQLLSFVSSPLIHLLHLHVMILKMGHRQLIKGSCFSPLILGIFEILQCTLGKISFKENMIM